MKFALIYFDLYSLTQFSTPIAWINKYLLKSYYSSNANSSNFLHRRFSWKKKRFRKHEIATKPDYIG